jgi:hypothetical protein
MASSAILIDAEPTHQGAAGAAQIVQRDAAVALQLGD